MLRFIHKRKAQSTLEYAVLIMIIIGALVSIQTYIKRGVQGRLKSSADDVGDQFSPGNTNSVKTTSTHSKTQQLFGQDASGAAKQGVSTEAIIDKEVTNTQENASIINTNQEYWGSTAP